MEKEVEESRFSHMQKIFLITFIALYILNVFGDYSYVLLILVPFILLILMNVIYRKKSAIAISLLFVFILSTLITGTYYNQFSIANYLELSIYPIFMYLIGLKLTEYDYRYKNTLNVAYVIIFSAFLYMILNYYKTIAVYGSIESAFSDLDNRPLLDFWNSGEKPATVVVVYLSFSLAILPNLLFRNKDYSKLKNFVIKSIMLTSFAFSLYISVELGSRTSFIIIIISIITVHFLLFHFSLRKFLNYILALLLLVFFFFLYNLDLFNLKSMWETSRLFERFQSSGLESGRFEVWKDALTGLYHNPLGGRNSISSLEYVHNLWLDVANDVGFVPFILLLVFSIVSVFSLLKLVYSKKHPNIIKALFISMYTAFFISFMSEPILRTQERFYFSVFCLVVGLVQGINSLKAPIKKE